MFWLTRQKPRRVREHFELLLEALGVIIQNQENAMSTAKENFEAAAADLADKFAALDSAIAQAVVDLKAAFARNDDVAFQAAADKLTALSGKAAADTVALLDADKPAAVPEPPAAPTPAPAPEPAPAPAEPAPEPAPATAPEPAPANPDAPAPSAPPPVSA